MIKKILIFSLMLFLVSVVPIGFGDLAQEEKIHVDVPSDPVIVSFGERKQVPVSIGNRGENGVIVRLEMEENNWINSNKTSDIILHPGDSKTISMLVTCKEGVAGPSETNIKVIMLKYDSKGELKQDSIVSEKVNVNCEKGSIFQRKPFEVVTMVFIFTVFSSFLLRKMHQ